jgi:Raf kinase inhibitor-like YbhB/YbcL family protein
MSLKKSFIIILILSILGSVLAACKPPKVYPPNAGFMITIPAFPDSGDIPARYTCSGEDISPAIRFSGSEPETKSLALILEDLDAPGGLFIHWVIYNIPPASSDLPEAIQPAAQVPGIGTQGKNSFGSDGYGGPCPPPGSPHSYEFRIFALDLAPDLPADLTAAQLEAKMKDHILDESERGGFQTINPYLTPPPLP